MKYTVTGKQHNDEKCFICGYKNPSGVGAEFFNCVDEAGGAVLITTFRTKDCHQSYPGRTHGGVISAILDESVGRAIELALPDIWAVTIDLSVKFRKPVPIGEDLYIVSRITKIADRFFEGEGEMVDGTGLVLATAVGKFFRLPLEKAVNDKNAGLRLQKIIGESPKEFVI
jgi:acyl-coenzyme A thioesterase PaaI-like protein